MSTPVQLGASAIVKPGIVQASDAATYTQLTGQDCPLYDPTQARKLWWDTAIANSAQPTDRVNYVVLGFDQNGNPGFVPLTMTVAQARSVNIDAFGTFETYAAYVTGLPATNTTYSLGAPFNTLPPQPLAVVNLSTPAEAAQVVNEILRDNLGLSVSATVLSAQSGSVYNYDPNDARRVYDIVIGNQQYSLMLLLQNRFASGVWCPGKWSIDPARGPVFTPETFPSSPANTTDPLPADPQYTDTSKWQVIALFGGVLAVIPAGQSPAPSGTATDTPLAIDTNNKVTALWKMLPPAQQGA